MGVNDYSSHLRIDAAKILIREQNFSFSQIAARLGYSSLSYFTRQFGRISGMSPTEYRKTYKQDRGAGIPKVIRKTEE